MITPFNELTPAEAERLAFLAEECGELVQAVCKILRHGYDSTNPLEENGKDNRWKLVNEMGNVRAAMLIMCEYRDVKKADIHDAAEKKLFTVQQWLHHQPPTLMDT